MIATLNGIDSILIGVLAFFALLALVTLVRVVMNRESTAWRQLRVGFFVERDRRDDDRE